MSAPTTAFDAAPYAHAPTISAASGIVLANALHAACPKGADARVKKAARHLKSVGDKALADITARNAKLGAYPEEDSRALDNEADRIWGALRLRLQAAAMIREHSADAARAAELDALLFQGSTEFLKGEYAVQSTRMAAILMLIKRDGLGADLDRIAGAEYLAAARDVQPRYEAMVTERLRRDALMGQNLNDTVIALKAAIVNYASKVIGTIEHDDPATAEEARVALLPIVNHRTNVAPDTTTTVATPTPTTKPG